MFTERERERTGIREKEREKERDGGGGKARDKEARERDRERGADERLPALRFRDEVYEYIAQRAIEELFTLEASPSANAAGPAAGGDNTLPVGAGQARPVTPSGRAAPAVTKSATGTSLKSANPRDQKKVDDSYGEWASYEYTLEHAFTRKYRMYGNGINYLTQSIHSTSILYLWLN